LIVLTSDHGYSLGDHDTIKKFTLWEEAGRAPLIFAGPGVPAGERINKVVSLLDIAPTLLDRARIPVPERMDCHSLLPCFARPDFRTWKYGALTDMWESVSLRTNRW